MTDAGSPLLSRGQETCALEVTHVFEHGREGERMLRPQLFHRGVASPELHEHGAPDRISERAEGAVKRCVIVYHTVNYGATPSVPSRGSIRPDACDAVRYSPRKVMAGSRRAARHAGTALASAAMVTRSARTPA